MTAHHILVVDDEVGIRELLRDILEDEGYHVRLAENAAEAREFRMNQRPDLVLLDIWMPDCDGVTLLKEWVNGGQLTMPVVMMSGHATVDTAVEATRIGAFDFLEKPVALQKLLKTVGAALKHGEHLPRQGMSLINLGKSAPIIELRQRLEHAAKQAAPILLVGPHGSGMELCARALHKTDTPWVEITTHRERLAQAPIELLDHAKDGVLYIPEIASLNHSEQKGLLLLLQKSEKSAARVICTTSRDLPQLAAAGQFEEALLQAVSALTVRVPALNDHREDIPELARAINLQLAEQGGVSFRELDTAALNALRNAAWPGNLTQLENVVRRLMTGSLGDTITQDDVQRVLQEFSGLEPAPAEPVSSASVSPVSLDQPLREARDEFERIYFEHHIAKAGGNMSRVAEFVGLERTHLYRKLKQLGIKVR